MNKNILDQVLAAGAQLVAVTKYLSPEETTALLPELTSNPVFFGLGENRVESLKSKKLPREHTHFIGRLQSRKFPQIIHHCGTIHSLDKLSHAEKINKICDDKNLLIKIFIQINISEEIQKGGINPVDLPDFLTQLRPFENVRVIGLSGMGSGEPRTANRKQKAEEFKLLKNLRDKHLPDGLISAGTSHDYEIALAQGIDVIRVGRGLFSSVSELENSRRF